jgi:hypothetical protein
MTEETRESSFDALAKGMASGTVSRGRALRLMGAALLGGTLASVPAIASAAAPPRPNGRKCKQSSQCASGNCSSGTCQPVPCQAGLTRCNGGCTDTATDDMNCGGCNMFCDLGDSCVNGACVNDVPACTTSCCCSCTYKDDAGTEISQCFSPFTGESCQGFCSTSEESGGVLPPGSTFVRAEGACSAASDPTAQICLRGVCVARTCAQAPA